MSAAKNTLPAEITAGFLKKPDDLSQLTYIKAEAVQKFVQELNNFTAAKLNGKKLVAAIGTGGTISMKVQNGISIPDLNFAGIFAHTNSHLDEAFQMVSLDAFQIDSSQMNFCHISDLAIVMTYVWNNLSVSLTGFLIIHGTDTMAYSAAAMSLITGRGLPFSVIYTGAQKSIQEPMNDAGINLRNALFTLEALYKANMAEVVVVMGDKAMLGTSAIKIDDTLVNAFAAPLHKYVTTFATLEYPIRLAPWLKQRRDQPFRPTIWKGAYSHTLLVNSNLGLNPDMVGREIRNSDIQAVLLYSYGAGTVYDAVADSIMQEARARQIPVFVVSPVNSEYKVVYESGKKLVEKGVVPLLMTLPTAMAKIEIAVRMFPADIAAISNFMKESYVGEIPSEYSRFSPVLER